MVRDVLRLLTRLVAISALFAALSPGSSFARVPAGVVDSPMAGRARRPCSEGLATTMRTTSGSGPLGPT